MRLLLAQVVVLLTLLGPSSAGAEKATKDAAWTLFADGERLRLAGQFDRSLERCLTAWELGYPWGLICAARTERSRGRYIAARSYLASLDRFLIVRGSKDVSLELVLFDERKQLDEIEGRHRWLLRNRPDFGPDGPLVKQGEKIRATVRLTNRSRHELKIDRVECSGLGKGVFVKWVTAKRVLPADASVIGTIDFAAANWQAGAVVRAYGTIEDTPVEREWHPVKMIWADPPDPRWTHLTVALRATYGGFWVPMPVEMTGLNRLEPTSAAGVALRLQKGFGKYLAVEGEIAGGATATAEFDPGMTRSGRYGRVVVQGVARYGDRWVGSLRLGTGLQIAAYDSNNPDLNGIEVDPLYALGIGFDFRVRSLTIGLHGDYFAGLRSGASMLGLGLQIGYGWPL